MAAEIRKEIGHVLFIDIVGYSKLLIDEQAPIEILARVSAQMGEPDRAIATLQKLLSTRYEGPLAEGLPLTPALVRLDPMFETDAE